MEQILIDSCYVHHILLFYQCYKENASIIEVPTPIDLY